MAGDTALLALIILSLVSALLTTRTAASDVRALPAPWTRRTQR